MLKKKKERGEQFTSTQKYKLAENCNFFLT